MSYVYPAALIAGARMAGHTVIPGQNSLVIGGEQTPPTVAAVNERLAELGDSAATYVGAALTHVSVENAAAIGGVVNAPEEQ